MLNFMKRWKLSKEIVALMEEKQRVEIDLKNLQQNIEHETRRKEMAIEEERMKHRVEMDKLVKESEIKHTETVTLLRLESEQKLKQSEINFERQKNDLLAKSKMDQTAFEGKISRDYYEKLQEALGDLHSKGNVTTQFMQDLTMQMFAQIPKFGRTRTNVRVKAELPSAKKTE